MASTDTHKRKAYRVPDKPALEITDYTGWRSLLNPLWCYHGFRMAVVGLTCFGLIMVFSSSTVTMAALGKSPFLQLLNQGAFCLIGLVLGFVALMMPVTFWKRTGVAARSGAWSPPTAPDRRALCGGCLPVAGADLYSFGYRRLWQQRLAEPRLHHYPAG